MTEVDLFNQALQSISQQRIRLDAAKTVSSATAANPVVCTTSAPHGYASDALVLITAMDQMTPVNGRVFRIAVLTTTTFQLVGENGAAYTAESTGGLVQKLSSGDVSEVPFAVWPSMRREVLAKHPWNEATRYARLARLQASKTITGVTQASPAVVTAAAHGYSAGDLVLVDGIVGMVELNGRYHTVANPTANTFQLAGEDSSAYAAYVSGGTARKALTPLRPDFSYECRYTAPADCVRVLNLAEPGRETEQWEAVATEIFTDEGPTVPIRYTALLTDPASFSPELFSALAARLAHEISPRITESVSREERAEKRYEKQISSARRTDSQQQGPAPIADAGGSWLNERY
jgi:hypothetical protein